MKKLAQWAMSGRWQATVAAGACLAFPLLFWLGAALLALVILRYGWQQAGQVVLWALLPGITWLAMGDPTPLLTALGTSALAVMLRASIRLDWTVMLSSVLGIVVYYLLPSMLPEVLPQVAANSEAAVAEALKNEPELLAQLQPLVSPMISGVLAALHSLVFMLCLLLGRYWQSTFYNPGGFGTEFKQLRLPLVFSLPVILVMFSASQLDPELAGLMPVFTIPLMLAGLALFHGLVTQTKASPTWMVVIYIGIFVLGPYMYTLLIFVACLDSAWNFRARLPKDTAD